MTNGSPLKRILCYGDSNTWGYIPKNGDAVNRYAPHVRWTGQLQKLGQGNFLIIEEGLNGRTTGIEDPEFPGRNGDDYLLPCLESHFPLDLVILMLGTNDLKHKFNPVPEVIAQRMAAMIQKIRQVAKTESRKPSQVLLLSLPKLLLAYTYDKFIYPELEGNLVKLNRLYRELAERERTHFLDIENIVQTSRVDGVHLDEGEHAIFAAAVMEKLKTVPQLCS